MNDGFRDELASILLDIKKFSLSFRGRRPEEASELAHDTILMALRSEAAFVPGTNMKAWVFTLMSNIERNSARKHRNRSRHEAYVEAPDFAVDAAQDSVADWADTRRVIEALSPEHRLALMLVAYDGESYADAAALLGCEVGTVKSRVSRARALIREALERNETEPGRKAEPVPS